MKNINFQRSRMSHSLHGLVLPLVLSLVLTGAGCGSKTKVTESDLSATTNRGVTSNELPAPTSSVRSTAQEVSVTCDDKVNRRAKLICDLLKSNDHDAQTESLPPLEVIYRNIDLNADGKNEIVAWESSWSGTSGGMLWFLEESDAGMRIVSEIEMTWTPIILLTSENNKWRDIAYLSTGSGAEPTFVKVSHDGNSYKNIGQEIPTQPDGLVLIPKKWNSSAFGPKTE